MAVSQRLHLPEFRDLFLVFLVAVFPVHFWLLLSYLHELPAYLLRLSISEMFGVLAYSQLFALGESLIITGIVLLLAMILPRRWIRKNLVANASLLILVSALWIAPVHYSGTLLKMLNGNGLSLAIIWLLWGGLYFITIHALIRIAGRKQRFRETVLAFVERISILSGIYLFIDLIGLITVTVRLFS